MKKLLCKPCAVALADRGKTVLLALSVKNPCIFNNFTAFNFQCTPICTPKTLFWIVRKCLVDLRDQILRLIVG